VCHVGKAKLTHISLISTFSSLQNPCVLEK
jgi:hypothetical protein